MHRSVRLLAAVALSAVLVAACGGAASPAPTPQTVAVTATEFKFDPSAISVSTGSAITISLTNGGTIEHDFTIDALNAKVLVKAGEIAEAKLGDLAAGTYDFYCSIPGHKEAGMVGTLEVK